jgi:hypothetical protein
MDFAVEFTHPEGPKEGLKAIRTLEVVLRKNGCKPWDHGTNFAPRRIKGRRVDTYLSSDVTATGQHIPMKAIRETLYGELEIRRFKVTKLKY